MAQKNGRNTKKGKENFKPNPPVLSQKNFPKILRLNFVKETYSFFWNEQSIFAGKNGGVKVDAAITQDLSWGHLSVVFSTPVGFVFLHKPSFCPE